MSGIGGHTRPGRGARLDWLTPPGLLAGLGEFDLDPCCPPEMPWCTARTMWGLRPGRHVEVRDGLAATWFGRVWLNPPYDRATGRWMARMAEHGNGVALVFARTETALFRDHVWPAASAVLFLEGRLHFYHPDGKRAKGNAGGPSCLVAYGERNARSLMRACRRGALVRVCGGTENLNEVVCDE